MRWWQFVTGSGAVLFAVVGSGVLGQTRPGDADFALQNGLGLTAAVLLALGIAGMRWTIAAAAGGRLLTWGLWCSWTGLAAAAAMHALAVVTGGASSGAGEAAALVGIPLTFAAHLLYPGTSLIGVALLRGRRAPTWVGALLAASLPLMLVGVPLSLTLGAGGAATAVAWIATEGQVAVAWFVLAVLAPRWRAVPRTG